MSETWRAALVIARRDFSAIVFSKTFILFLLGPLFPVLIFAFISNMGANIDKDSPRPAVGIAMPVPDAAKLNGARARIAQQMGGDAIPELRLYSPASNPKVVLARKGEGVVAMLSGTIDAPLLTGRAGDITHFEGPLTLAINMARAGSAVPSTPMATQIVTASTGSEKQGRLLTAQTSQVLLFLLTMLLAGMVLSNMVEEKTNKIIEVLAAAVPVDAIFLGKLVAMLAMSFVGIIVWGAVAVGGYTLFVGSSFPLPEPAIGWPVFIVLGFAYFAMAYTLLGSLFIGIGAQASTVREVQTLSMPITMCQVVIFFFASYAVNHMGSPQEVAATIFPFSSPFAMIARAAQSDAIWPHLLAIMWQLLWVALIIRLGVRLFRRNVLKSGVGGRPQRRLFGRQRRQHLPA